MNNLTTLSDITHSDVTHMTLKEITDLLEVRHNDAMSTVERMAENEEFGLVTKISYPIISGKGREQLIETYQLNKRQSIAVAAKLNTTLLMRIIDRWQELEQVTQVVADTLQVDKETMIKELKQDDTINMLKSRIETRNIKLQALKDKLAEQSKVLHARTTKLLSQGALVKGDMTAGKLDMPTDTITNLLKEHGSTIEPKLANWALRQLGYLTKTHEVTDTGHYYGRNIKSSPRSKTTLARWFPSEFPELLKQIESTIEDLVNN